MILRNGKCVSCLEESVGVLIPQLQISGAAVSLISLIV